MLQWSSRPPCFLAIVISIAPIIGYKEFVLVSNIEILLKVFIYNVLVHF